MLTPQDIQEKAFAKAVFGGYEMAAVDEFLEEIGDDYTALFKENATLKANMRALLEKVKEYRATEDAMCGALLTAQKISDQQVSEAGEKAQQIVADARKEAAALIADAEEQFDLKKSEFGRRTAAEVEGVHQARAATAEYLNASRQLLARQAEMLARLEKLNRQPEPTKADADTIPAVKAAPAPKKAESASEGTKVFGSDFKEAVKNADQYSFDDLDLNSLTK